MMKKVLALLLVFCLSLSIVSAMADIDIEKIGLQDATDEELEELLTAVKTEQRARIRTKIVFDSPEVSIAKGKTVKVKATVEELPEGVKAGKFKWSSADKKIASVSNGSIRGGDAGTTIITCETTLSDGTEIYSECTVTVYIPVNSIAFTSKKTEGILAGSKYTPEIVIKPDNATNQTLAFESSDPTIAVITEDGQIEVVGEGTVTITATTTDGSNKKATCTLITKDPPHMSVNEGGEPDGRNTQVIVLPFALELEGFSINLSKAEYVLYETEEEAVSTVPTGPICALIRMQKSVPDYDLALVYANVEVFKLGEGLDAAAMKQAAEEAYLAYNRYDYSLKNDINEYYDGITLDETGEAAETTVAGEACLKRTMQLYTSQDKIVKLNPNETTMYYFPAKGYLFCIDFTRLASKDDKDPDALMESILTWE